MDVRSKCIRGNKEKNGYSILRRLDTEEAPDELDYDRQLSCKGDIFNGMVCNPG